MLYQHLLSPESSSMSVSSSESSQSSDRKGCFKWSAVSSLIIPFNALAIVSVLELIFAMELLMGYSESSQELPMVLRMVMGCLSIMAFAIGLIAAKTRSNEILAFFFAIYTILVLCFAVFAVMKAIHGEWWMFAKWLVFTLIKIYLNFNIFRFNQEMDTADLHHENVDVKDINHKDSVI